MREETRYRVTGSLLLLALAVICLPMLLDGAGLPARSLPALPMEPGLPHVEPLSRRAPDSDFQRRVEELRRQVDEDGFLTGSGTRFGEPVLTPPGEQPLRSGGEASPRPRPPEPEGGPAEGLPTEREATSVVQRNGWAVQVASFTRSDNAKEFRARLRKDGYEAFISTARLDDRVLNRVAVGPFLDRRRAETLRNELAARYDVQARLMALSN